MAKARVTRYRLGYDVDAGQFLFTFFVHAVPGVQNLPVSPQQFLALADMFRNEGGIVYDSETQILQTDPEPVGEGEPGAPAGRPAPDLPLERP